MKFLLVSDIISNPDLVFVYKKSVFRDGFFYGAFYEKNKFTEYIYYLFG